jgi:hypothetical protein
VRPSVKTRPARYVFQQPVSGIDGGVGESSRMALAAGRAHL